MFTRVILKVVILIVISAKLYEALPPPRVKLPHGGALIGTYIKTVHGRVVDAFLGVPYANPPIGNLRFAAPEYITQWQGEKIVNKDTLPCMQYNLFAPGSNKTTGSEDCLYVNVYTPNDRQKGLKLSVIIWFHGGAFRLGKSDSKETGPQRLLDHDIVLITCSYRLGAFGFLSTGTRDSPGNYGLKDQSMALQWIRDNIEAFGGNPNDVTVAGQSAGGASASFHLVSPLSKGLFHKAIMQSGNFFDFWTIIDSDIAIDRTRKLASMVGCSTEDDDFTEMVACLRKVPAAKISSETEKLSIFPVGSPLTTFAPVVEPNISLSFLPENPRHIRNSYGHNIPIIIGVTKDDGLMETAAIIHLYNKEFKENFNKLLPIMLGYNNRPPNVQNEITAKLDKNYLNGYRDWTTNTHQNLTNLFSDSLFYSGMDRFLRNRFEATNFGPTYIYMFNHRGPKSFTEMYGGGPEYYGVAHLDEIPFLFPSNQADLPGSTLDVEMRYAMTKMWTDFVRTGNPTPQGSPIRPKWKRSSGYPLNYMQLGNPHQEQSLNSNSDEGKQSLEINRTNRIHKHTKGNSTLENLRRQDATDTNNVEGTVAKFRMNPDIIGNRAGLVEERLDFWRKLEKCLAWT